MLFAAPPIEARLVKRYKRFLADVRMPSGDVITAHCPNTGRLEGCKDEGSRVWLRDSGDPRRKLRYTWQAVRVGRTWVNVDTHLPNRVVAEAIEAGTIPELADVGELRREVSVGGGSRLDIGLTAPDGRQTYIEVKNTTLARGSTGLFPDAVTERGRKHLDVLLRLHRRGHRAVQFYLVSRADVRRFRPADDIDPEYGKALRRAVKGGVEVLAWCARVGPRRLELLRPLPVEYGVAHQP